MYGDITFKAAEQLRKPEVVDFFASLIQRVAPKSYQQAAAEVVITRQFLDNFGGDQVCQSGGKCHTCPFPVCAALHTAHLVCQNMQHCFFAVSICTISVSRTRRACLLLEDDCANAEPPRYMAWEG